MRSIILGFVAGAAILQNQASLPTVQTLVVLFILGILAIVFTSRFDPGRIIQVAIRGSAGLALGFAWAAAFAHFYLSKELPKEWEGRDITVIGTVDSLPYYFAQGVRFNLAVERIVSPDGPSSLPPKLALSWYSAFQRDELQAVGKVQPGERWQLTVRLRRPHGNANPHGFDYEVWLLEQNLRATGYVRPDLRSDLKNERLAEFVPSFGNIVQRCRAWLRERIHEALPEKEYAGVVVALVIGDQRAISQSDWQVFNRTGIGHLISISGLHITMIAGMFAALVLALWRRSFFTNASLPLILPAQKAAALAGAAIALLYVLLAGFGVPAQRTLYMLSVVAMSLWFGRITNVSYVLCAALGLVAVLDPWAVLWPGFWLSFGAVALLVFASAGRTGEGANANAKGLARWVDRLKMAAYTQYVVTIGLVPLTMLLFAQVSLVSPFANAVAIPLISFLVTPLALIGSVLPMPLAAWVLGFAHVLIEALAELLSWLSSFPVAVWSAPVPEWWAFAVALLGIMWLLAPSGWPVRWLGLAGLLPMLLNTASHPGEGEVWVTAFDVGQGTALLVETQGRRLLYDTGPAYSQESDGGNRVILPYLKARGISRLDAVIVSHSDKDHSGGALSILDEVDVDSVLSSLPANHPIATRAARHTRCEAGQSWNWNGVQFNMLHPSGSSYESIGWKPNARSCTLKVTVGEHSILLAGDIEAGQEADLIRAGSSALRSTVLLAPHHGSGTSSSAAFLDAVAPQVALFQVGYRNRYRHPKAEVYERYGQRGIRRVRSDEAGAVLLRLSKGKEMEVTEYRNQHARYWHGR